MSPSAKSYLFASAVLALLVITAAALLQDDFSTRPRSASDEDAEFHIDTADTGTARVDTRTRTGRNSTGKNRSTTRTAADAPTSGLQLLPAMQPAQLPPLTGYTIDSFESWTTLPASYASEGIILRNGAITLADAATSPPARFGQLVSPPLPLKSPALSGASESRRPMPSGAALTLEISLSENGSDWTGWIPIEKYNPPDGKRVTAPFQAAISQAELAAAAAGSTTSSSVSAPSLRYRLSLSSSGPAAPAIADIRIWKRELQ